MNIQRSAWTRNVVLGLVLVGSACRSTDGASAERAFAEARRFEAHVVQQEVDALVQSMLSSETLARLAPKNGDDSRIVLFVGDVRDASDGRADAVLVRDALRAALQRSGRFRLRPRSSTESGAAHVDPHPSAAPSSPEVSLQSAASSGATLLWRARLRALDGQAGRAAVGLDSELVDVGSGVTLWSGSRALHRRTPELADG